MEGVLGVLCISNGIEKVYFSMTVLIEINTRFVETEKGFTTLFHELLEF